EGEEAEAFPDLCQLAQIEGALVCCARRQRLCGFEDKSEAVGPLRLALHRRGECEEALCAGAIGGGCEFGGEDLLERAVGGHCPGCVGGDEFAEALVDDCYGGRGG